MPTPLSFSEYQASVDKNLVDEGLERGLTHNGLGLAGEAGEVVDEIKKVLFQGKTLDRGILIHELGDALWYIAALARKLGSTIEEVAAHNMLKVGARYPEGWSIEAAVRAQQAKEPKTPSP